MTKSQRIREHLDSIIARDPAARNRWEVAALYPGFHAVCAHRVSHWLWRRGAKFPARTLSQLSRAVTGIEIHPGAQIGERFFIDHGMGVVIGETAEIGDDVTMYHGTTLGGTSLQAVKRHPTVGDGVIIGTGAKVLGPVEIGDHSRVGANAVLLRSVPQESVVVGVPGQIIKSHGQPAGIPATPHHDESSPDPVGMALRALVARVDRLENEVTGTIEVGTSRPSEVGVWDSADFSI